jgi:hypothetical protein
MRAPGRLIAVLLLGLSTLGCGKSGFVKPRGKVIKAGQPYCTPEGEGLRIFLSPIDAQSKGYDSYAAEYNQDDGSFRVVGKDGNGLPPGKYHVSLQLMKSKEDLLNNKLLGKGSPLTCEVTSAGDDLVIDLDQANFDALLAQAAAPAKRKGPHR